MVKCAQCEYLFIVSSVKMVCHGKDPLPVIYNVFISPQERRKKKETSESIQGGRHNKHRSLPLAPNGNAEIM